jgi:hypothetical protein
VRSGHSVLEHLVVTRSDRPGSAGLHQSAPDEQFRFVHHIPSFHVSRLRERSALPDGATLQRFRAAVLFVDIVGFTKLTDDLSSSGREGTEGVSNVLNRALDPVVRRISDLGGDVVVFAGDAVLAVWPCGTGRAEEFDQERAAVQNAADTAAWVAARARVRSDGDSGQGAVEFRAAVGVGGLIAMEVGGDMGRWSLLVAGPGILDAVEADALARPGWAVGSSSARRTGGLKGTEIGGGAVRLPARTASDENAGPRQSEAETAPSRSAGDRIDRLASAYLPRVSVARLGAGQGEWLAEFRTLSVIFLRVDPYPGQRDPDLQTVHQATLAFQAALRRYDGDLYNTLYDDKGTVLIGIFGLPLQAHEDDPERALRAAIEVLAELRGRGVSVSVGVTSGLAHSGLYEAGDRRQYMVSGSVMNLAARLMTRAEGRVLCDRATSERCDASSGIDTALIGEVSLKGMDGPVGTFTAELREPSDAEPSSPADSGGFAGRVRERRQLEALIREAQRSGRPRAALIEGEAGIGKSLLAGRVMRDALGRGLEGMASRAREMERDTPFFPWRRIVQSILAHEDLTDLPVQDRLEALGLPKDLVAGAPLLTSVLPLDVPEASSTLGLPEDARGDLLRRLIAGIVGAPGRPSHLVWLEDVHWMDSASWAVLGELVALEAPVTVLLTARSDSDPRVEDLFDLQKVTRFTLGPLGEGEQRDILRTLWRVEEVEDPVVRWMAEKTRGNPMFLSQLALAMLEADGVDSSGARARFAAGTEFDLDSDREAPLASAPNVEAVITSRVDALDVRAQLTLRALAVLAHTVDEETLADLHPASPTASELGADLEVLSRKRLIELETTGDGRQVRVVQGLIQDSVYAGVPFSLRTRLHHRMGAALEARGGSLDHPTVAFHWMRAGEPSRALQHLGAAGLEALNVFANQEAVSFLSRGLRVAEELSLDTRPDRRAEIAKWRLGLGSAFVHLQHYPRGVQHLGDGLSLLGESLPSSRVGASFAGATAFLRHLSRRAVSVVSRRGRGVVPDVRRQALLERSRAYERLVEAHYVGGDPARTLFAALRALDRAEEAGPSAELARGYATMGAMFGFMPIHRGAMSYGLRAIRVAEASGDPSAMAWACLTLGIYHAGRCEWEAAGELIAEGADLAWRAGDRRRWMDCQSHLAQMALLRGELKDARKLAFADPRSDEGGEGERGTAAPPGATGALIRIRTLVQIAIGELDGAEQSMREWEHELSGRSIELDLQSAMTAAFRVSVGRARSWEAGTGEAPVGLEAALALPSAPAFDLVAEFEGLLDALLPPPSDGGESGWSTIRPEHFSTLNRRLKAHQRVFPLSGPAYLIASAYSRRSTSPERFARTMGAAAERARALGRPLMEAAALLHLGCALPSSSEEGTGALERAASMFEQRGAALHARRARAQLASR